MTEVPDVPVSLVDLEAISAALSASFHQNTVLDLADGYRRLTANPKPSPLTRSLERSLALVDSYINQEEEETEDE